MESVHCETCNVVFRKTRYQIRKQKHHFCSQKCYGVWLKHNRKQPKTRVVVYCATCNKPIERQLHKIKRSQRFFCNLECRAAAQSQDMKGDGNPNYIRIDVKCDNCGTDLKIIPYSQRWERHFCDQKCRGQWQAKYIVAEKHPNWTGGEVCYRGPNWKEQRNAARQRDHHRCQACGVTERRTKRILPVHHIVPFRMFGYIPGENENYKEANQLGNLITLCPSCHKKAEHGKISLQLRLL